MAFLPEYTPERAYLFRREKNAVLKKIIKEFGLEAYGIGASPDNQEIAISIPADKQQPSYPLTLTKKGFKTATETYIPQSQTAEYRLTKKEG